MTQVWNVPFDEKRLPIDSCIDTQDIRRAIQSIFTLRFRHIQLWDLRFVLMLKASINWGLPSKRERLKSGTQCICLKYVWTASAKNSWNVVLLAAGTCLNWHRIQRCIGQLYCNDETLILSLCSLRSLVCTETLTSSVWRKIRRKLFRKASGKKLTRTLKGHLD